MNTINEGFLKDIFTKDLTPQQKEKVNSTIKTGIVVKNKSGSSLEQLRARHQAGMRRSINKNEDSYYKANMKNKGIKA